MTKIFTLVVLCFLTACTEDSSELRRFQVEWFGYFDTVVVFTGYAVNTEEFDRYSDEIGSRLADLHRLFDIYNSYEGLNNLHTVNTNAGVAPVAVREEIIDLLLAAREAYEITGGAVNVAMGAVLRIWHETAALPDLQDLLYASNFIDFARIEINEVAGTVFLLDAEMSIDVGSIAKGFAAGLVMERATQNGLVAGVLSAGGHVVAVGTPPDADAWRVGIQGTETIDTVNIKNATVSVSGGIFRYFEVEEGRLGHIIDPKTLFPADRFLQVAVIHQNSWMADVLSTAIFILPQDEGAALAERMNAEVMWLYHDGTKK